jgi:hypothetical protein
VFNKYGDALFRRSNFFRIGVRESWKRGEIPHKGGGFMVKCKLRGRGGGATQGRGVHLL